jgi:pimeloyl-ACP methyl ester carboxylesterase
MLTGMRGRTFLILASLALAAAAWPVRALAQAPSDLPAQKATFKVFLRGSPVGSEEASVEPDADGWLITATSVLSPPLNLTVRRAEVRYDAGWRPRSLVIEGNLRGRAFDFQTTFADGKATTRMKQPDGEPIEKTDTVAPDTVALPNNFYAAYTALAIRLAAATPGSEVRAYVAPQAEIGVLLNGVDAQRMQVPGRAFDVRKYRVSLKNPGRALDAEIWAEPGGRLVRVSIPDASFDIIREDVATVAAREQKFNREGDEDVTIPANGFNLAGTVSKPKPSGASTPAGAAPARLPGIVLVGGSGPVDRDEVVAGIPIFGQLASALADAGFLVLRYDKRGIGLSGGRAETATLEDFAEDAVAAVKYLEKRKDVDPKRITIVGHSEGAWVALIAASRDKDIARVATMAGPGSTGGELVLEQQRHLLERSDMSEAEKQDKIALQKKVQQATVTGTGWDGVPVDVRKRADTAWFRSFLAFDPKSVMPRVRQPLLVVLAELDTQVPPANAEALATIARARKKDPGVEVVRIAGVNHLFVAAKTGEVEEYGSLQSRTITPELPVAIAGWLRK